MKGTELNGFIQGLAWAVAMLNRMHDCPTMLAELLNESGFKLKHFRAVDEYDRSEIRKIWRTEKHRWKR